VVVDLGEAVRVVELSGEVEDLVGVRRRQVDARRRARREVPPFEHQLVRPQVWWELRRRRPHLERLRRAPRGQHAGIGYVDEGQIALR